MSLFDVAKESLTNLATSDIIKERLELAMDQANALEKKVLDLEGDKAVLQFQLQESQAQSQKDRRELESLKKMHEETVLIARGIEFRRGHRTGNSWQAFCPVCHMPIVTIGVGDRYATLGCSSGNCNWFTDFNPHDLGHFQTTLPQ